MSILLMRNKYSKGLIALVKDGFQRRLNLVAFLLVSGFQPAIWAISSKLNFIQDGRETALRVSLRIDGLAKSMLLSAARANYPREARVVMDNVEPDDAAVHLFKAPFTPPTSRALLSRPKNRARWYFGKVKCAFFHKHNTRKKEKTKNQNIARLYV